MLASLSFARAALLGHLKSQLPGVSVYLFRDLQDVQWERYLQTRKVSAMPFLRALIDVRCQPMFVLLNDGGVVEPEATPHKACCVLAQRLLLFELTSQNLACALLRGSDFRDSKVKLSP